MPRFYSECQCEHVSHFKDEGEHLTPNGLVGHDYGSQNGETQPVKTTMGTFYVCKDCANDCYKEGGYARPNDNSPR